MSLDTAAIAHEMRRHLTRLKALRGAPRDPVLAERIDALKRWQTARLLRTHADLLADPRYRAATEFFVEDLYGPKDFSRRDAALLRIVPVMARLLPAKAVETAALSVELEALTEALDQRIALALEEGPIEEASYAEAYRANGTRAERARQIRLVVEVGRRLDEVVRWPLVLRTLRMMRAPAKLAGLEDLQDFLEHGFAAFDAMHGADVFLATVERRETAIFNRLFAGDPEPFSPER
jgi:hypothetical protein